MQRMQVCFRFACELIFMSKNTFFLLFEMLKLLKIIKRKLFVNQTSLPGLVHRGVTHCKNPEIQNALFSK